MRITVTTAVFSPGAALVRWCEALWRQTDREFAVLVVDDASPQPVRWPGPVPANWRIARDELGQLWWGGGMERAFQAIARSGTDDDVIVITNVDTDLPSNLVAAVRMRFAVATSAICAVSPGTDEFGETTQGFWFDSKTLRCHVQKPGQPINSCWTRVFAFRVRDWRLVGGVDCLRFPHYISDVDFTYRLTHAGVRLEVMDEAPITFRKMETNNATLRAGRLMHNWQSLRSVRSKLALAPFLRLNAKFNRGPRRWLNATQLLLKAGAKLLFGQRR